MKTLLPAYLNRRLKIVFPLLMGLIFLFSCNDNLLVQTSDMSEQSMLTQSEVQGKFFYSNLQQHALDDPLKYVVDIQERKILSSKFDSLKTSGTINFEAILNDAISKNQISKVSSDILLDYNENLVEYVKQNPDIDKCWKWSSAQENIVFQRSDLPDSEKQMILDHMVRLRFYIKYTLETNKNIESANSIARIEGGASILCYVGCAINNISSFSSVGSLANSKGSIVGSLVGAGVGLIYTIVNSSSCGCGSQSSCGAATSVSTPDVCYSSTTGLPFTAWGYGIIPGEFRWDFYLEDLSNSPITRATYNSDQYTLTNTELNGASKLAIRATSVCSGTYFYSNDFWVSPGDNGKPRPVVNAYQGGSNQVQYIVNGSNINSIAWAYIPPYRGTVVASTSNSITVAWVANMRIGVFVTATSSCGTATTSTY